MIINGVTFPMDTVDQLCREAGVVRMYVFGSILTDHFGRDSDIDLLIETNPAAPPGLLRLGGFQMDLSDLLGRTVHLTLLGGVPVAARAEVLSRARRLDAA